jgi:hypothetical protein
MVFQFKMKIMELSFEIQSLKDLPCMSSHKWKKIIASVQTNFKFRIKGKVTPNFSGWEFHHEKLTNESSIKSSSFVLENLRH